MISRDDFVGYRATKIILPPKDYARGIVEIAEDCFNFLGLCKEIIQADLLVLSRDLANIIPM